VGGYYFETNTTITITHNMDRRTNKQNGNPIVLKSIGKKNYGIGNRRIYPRV
jgi:hypothetical protein